MKYFQSIKAGKQKLILNGLVLLAIFGAGLAIGLTQGIQWQKYSAQSGHELRLGGFKYINPLLECEVAGNAFEFSELESMEDAVASLIKEKRKQRPATHVSVYFRNLNTGSWFGINEDELFAPASLLKIPTVIAALKITEQQPDFLSKQILYSGKEDFNLMENMKPEHQVAPGKSYTVDELIYRSIIYSDNNANSLLFSSISPYQIEQIYRELNVPLPLTNMPDNFMSVRQYGAFFRILYNASYLSKEMSEKALEYMSNTMFRKGIAAGVPATTVVVNKFGERITADQPDIRQLHDCGIVYYPNRPYLLCIMSRADDFSYLTDTIREISQIVYEEMDRQQSVVAVQ